MNAIAEPVSNTRPIISGAVINFRPIGVLKKKHESGSDVCRNRSATSVPAASSILYLIGSAPIGTSMKTFTSSYGLLPMDRVDAQGCSEAAMSVVTKLKATGRGE
jgi:hypothetical protein